jgi:F-type H+-transporting ATPase subunit delta
MRGVSQASYARVADALAPVLTAAGADAARLGHEMFAVVDLLDRTSAVRRALTDPARAGEAKAALVASLLNGKVDERVVDTLSALARTRWSADADLTAALERLAAEAVLAGAEATGDLERVEEELFRFDRFLADREHRRLREALTDRMATPQARAKLARQLLEGKAHPVTVQLVERGAGAPRGRSMPVTLSEVGRLVAYRRRLLAALVTAAVPLSKAQTERLTRLLSRAYGRPVQVNVAVEPEVLGGVRIRVGDEVIDSTVATRIADLRRRLVG